jgi:hypothetical protein
MPSRGGAHIERILRLKSSGAACLIALMQTERRVRVPVLKLSLFASPLIRVRASILRGRRSPRHHDYWYRPLDIQRHLDIHRHFGPHRPGGVGHDVQ